MIGLKELLDDAKSGNFAARVVVASGSLIIIAVILLAYSILHIISRGGL